MQVCFHVFLNYLQMTSEQHYGHMLHKFDLCLAIEEDVRFVLLDYDEEKRRIKVIILLKAISHFLSGTT